MNQLPRATVLSLGGTIAMTNAQGDLGVRPALTAESLVAAVPTLSAFADVEARSLRNLPGASLDFDVMIELAAVIGEEARNGTRGVVVTQGTDTLEETAYAVDLILGDSTSIAVAFTGAMRNPTLPGAEGPANLDSAVRFVVSDGAADYGVVVVMNEEIHQARFVRKGHTSAPAAFKSRLTGRLGWLAEGRVRLTRPPLRFPPVPVTGKSMPVALITATMGDDGRLLPSVIEKGYRGLVVEALGGGHVPELWTDRLEELARSLPVVLTSRVGDGETLGSTYSFTGSEMDLAKRGLISGGLLDGPKARVLLTMLLGSGIVGSELREEFADRASQI